MKTVCGAVLFVVVFFFNQYLRVAGGMAANIFRNIAVLRGRRTASVLSAFQTVVHI